MDEKEFRERVEWLAVDTRGPLPPYEDPTTLTRRDHFAIEIVRAFIADGKYDYQSIAQHAYDLASEMELARNKEGES